MPHDLHGAFAVALLAGGRSTRMGRDKATMEWEGEPLWRRQMRILGELSASEILISAREGSAFQDADVRVVPDTLVDHGPLAGVAALLAATAQPLLLVLAVDLPRMTSAYLRELLGACEVGCGVVPGFGGRLEPLAAVYPQRTYATALEVLGQSARSMHQFAQACAARSLVRFISVSESDIPLFHNVNRPEDFC